MAILDNESTQLTGNEGGVFTPPVDSTPVIAPNVTEAPAQTTRMSREEITSRMNGTFTPSTAPIADTSFTAEPTPQTTGQMLGDSDVFMNALDSHESGNNNNATSLTGVKGRFQMESRFVEAFAPPEMLEQHTLDEIKSSPDLARQVAGNGVNYLAGKYDNDPDKVLAAYNAGEGLVDTAVRQFGNEWDTPEHLGASMSDNLITRIMDNDPTNFYGTTPAEVRLGKAREVLRHREGVLGGVGDAQIGGSVPSQQDLGPSSVSEIGLPSERDVEQAKSGAGNAIKKSLIRGGVGVADSFINLSRMVSSEGSDAEQWLNDAHNVLSRETDQFAIDDAMTQAYDDDGLKALFTSPEGLSHLGQILGEQVPQLALMAATAGGSKWISGSAKVGMWVGAASAGGLEGTSAYSGALEDGYSKEDAFKISAVVAGVATVGSLVQADKLAGGGVISGAMKKKLGQIGLGAMAEGLEEGAMPVADFLARQAVDPEEKIELPTLDAVWKESALGFTVGAIMGGGIGAIGGTDTDTGSETATPTEVPTNSELITASAQGDNVLMSVEANDRGHTEYMNYFQDEINNASDFATAQGWNPRTTQILVGKKLREFQTLGAYQEALGGDNGSQASNDINTAMSQITDELGVLGVTPKYMINNERSAIPVSEGTMDQVGKDYGVNSDITEEQRAKMLSNNRTMTQMTVLNSRLEQAMTDGDFAAQTAYAEEMRRLGGQIENVFENTPRLNMELFGLGKKELDTKRTELDDERYRIRTTSSGGRLTNQMQARIGQIQETLATIDEIQTQVNQTETTPLPATEGETLASQIPAGAIADAQTVSTAETDTQTGENVAEVTETPTSVQETVQEEVVDKEAQLAETVSKLEKRTTERASERTPEGQALQELDKTERGQKYSNALEREVIETGNISEERLAEIREEFPNVRDSRKASAEKRILTKTDDGYSEAKPSYERQLIREFPTDADTRITQDELDSFNARMKEEGVTVPKGKVLIEAESVKLTAKEKRAITNEKGAEIQSRFNSGAINGDQYVSELQALNESVAPVQTYKWGDRNIGKQANELQSTKSAQTTKTKTKSLDATSEGKDGSELSLVETIADDSFSVESALEDATLQSENIISVDEASALLLKAQDTGDISLFKDIIGNDTIVKARKKLAKAIKNGDSTVEFKLGKPVTSPDKVLGDVSQKAIDEILNDFGKSVNIEFADNAGEYGHIDFDHKSGKFTVTLNEGMTDADTLATLLHELGHASMATLAESNPKLWADINALYAEESKAGSELIDNIERLYGDISETRKVSEWVAHNMENSPLFEEDGSIDREYVEGNSDSMPVKIYKKLKQMLYKLIAKVTGLDLSTADKKRSITDRLIAEMFNKGINTPSEFKTEQKKTDTDATAKKKKKSVLRGDGNESITSEDIRTDIEENVVDRKVDSEIIDGIRTGDVKKGPLRDFTKAMRAFDAIQLSPRNIFDSILKVGKDSLAWKLFVTDLTEGRAVEAEWGNQANDVVTDLIDSTDADMTNMTRHRKGVLTKFFSKAKQKLGKGEDLIKYVPTDGIDADGNPTQINLTSLERVSLYLHGLNSDSRRHLKQGGFQISETEAPVMMNDSSFDKLVLSADEKIIADKMHDYFNKTQTDALAKKYEEVNGEKFEPVENYIPIRVTEGARGDSNNWNHYEDEISIDSFGKSLGSGKPGMIKERTNSGGSIYLDDVFQVLDSSSTMTGKYLGRAAEMHNAKQYWSTAKKQLLANDMKIEAAIIDDFLRDYSGDTVKNTFEKFMGKVHGKFAVATLGLKVTTALKQVASVGTASGEFTYGSVAEVTATMLKDLSVAAAGQSKAIKEVIEKVSPILKERFRGNVDSEINRQLSTSLGKAEQALMYPLTYMDTATIVTIWQSAEREIKHTNPELEVGSEEYLKAVNDKTVEVVEKTQPNFNTKDRSWIANQPGAKMLTMFFSARSQVWQTIRRAATDIKSDDPKKRAQAKRALFGTIVTQTVLLTMANEAKNAFKDEEDREKAFAGVSDYREYVNTALSGIVGASEILSVAKYGRDASTPVTELFSGAGGALANGKKWMFGADSKGKKISNDAQEQAGENFIEEVVKSAALMTGTPYSGVSDLMQPFKRAAEALSE